SFNAYVSIATNGVITIQCPAPEMGQGILTTLPMIVAEELDADWNRVVVEQSPIAAVYAHPIFKAQYVVASLSTFGYWTPLRMAGAQTRRMLMDAAAARWNVPVASLTTEPSVVAHAPSGRKLSYGEIAAFAKPPAQMPALDPAKDLKPVNQFRILGKSTPRVDMAGKSSGRVKYGIDASVPGMLYATLARSPVRDSGPVSSNADAIKKLPGVTDVVTLGHGIAVVGRNFHAVVKARRQLKVVWKDGLPGDGIYSDIDLQDFAEHTRQELRPAQDFRSHGDIAKGMAGAATVISREYLADHVYHAQMEPMNTLADVRGDSAEVWVGTQAPTRTALDVATAIKPTADKVKVNQMYRGGGYGRRATVEASVDAALISKAVGKPVKLLLTREDDLAAGTFRPMTAQKIDVAIDATGKIAGWKHRVAGEPVSDFLYAPGRNKAAGNRDLIFMSGAELPAYKVDNHLSEHLFERERTRTAAYRGIGSGYTKFAIESMIDEIAFETKQDPLKYRLSLMENPRARRLVEKVAEMSKWGSKREGTALGMAFGEYGPNIKIASMIAAVAEVSVDRKTGVIRVHNYWAAVDVGLALNPDGVAAQIEGATVWGLSSCLKERVTMVKGVVQQTNFNDYEILRMAETPNIQVEVINNPPQPTMVGELGVPVTGPAVANAVFALTGKRLRHLPMSPQRMLAALKA
ncbi:MAG: molybdopterin cofactor-binding domain-containing protein, partial [Burkholderiales bacterium]